jgi:hypothetical protein
VIKLTVSFRADASVEARSEWRIETAISKAGSEWSVSCLSFFHLSVRHDSLRYSTVLVQPKQMA